MILPPLAAQRDGDQIGPADKAKPVPARIAPAARPSPREQ